jgi:integrase
VELRNLRQTDVDLAEKVLRVRRSKTAAGRREIPLVDDAVTALERLRQRSAADGHVAPEHYLFPTCEHAVLDPTRPQKSWRTAWRALVREASRQAGRQAAQDAFAGGGRLGDAKRAFRLAAAPFVGLRFHDLRHQAITEMAENGTPESVIMSIAGHMSRRTVEHYSHVRRSAKREALSKIGGGLIPPSASQPSDASEA